MAHGAPTFHIREILASGAFATVCATQTSMFPDGRVIALKVLHAELAHQRDFLDRGRDEARVLSLLDHPNIVKVYALLDIEGRPVVLMQLVEGVSFEKLGKLDRAEAVALLLPVARALDYAWSTRPNVDGPPLRMVHRDIKPGNLLLSVDGEVKVVDFGLAKFEYDERATVTASRVVGSRHYAAPEVLDGDPGDGRPGDVYGLGLTFYELLTGLKLVRSIHPDRHAADVDGALEHLTESARLAAIKPLLTRMLAYEPEDRPTMAQVARSLGNLAKAEAPADIAALTERLVRPAWKQRERLPPIEHPSWPQVAMFESADLLAVAHRLATDEADRAREVAPSAAEADAAIRAFLQRPEWPAHVEELRALLDRTAVWTERPFLDVLSRAHRPWWQFWGHPSTSDELVAAVRILERRRSPDVVARVQRLASDRRSDVKEAAQAFLQA